MRFCMSSPSLRDVQCGPTCADGHRNLPTCPMNSEKTEAALKLKPIL